MSTRDEPSVYLREKRPGVYSIRPYFGRGEDGRIIWGKAETFTGDAKAALRRKKEIEIAILGGEFADLDTDTLAGFLKRYLHEQEVGGHVRSSTLRGYRTAVKRIPPKLGSKPINDLRPRDFKNMIVALDSSGLAASSIRQTLAVCGVALKAAVTAGELASDPMIGVKGPKVERRASFDEDATGKAMLRQDVDTIIRSFRASRPDLFATYFLAYATGMRRGELLGLHWSDIDLDARRLRVRRNLHWEQMTKEPEITPPKTASSKREIAFGASVVAVLATWREELRRVARLADAPMPRIVFPDLKTLDYMRPGALTARFRERCEEFAIDGNLHGLRHTHATELLADGEPVHRVSRRLGHSDVALTLRVYAHAIPGSDDEIAERCESVFDLASLTVAS
ncbi:MAG: tyrosine-type recombinase/integrase [Pseudomonadota bacterium]